MTIDEGDAYRYLPKNLNGAPQIENEEHNWLVVHFLQTTKNDEEDKIPSNQLVKEQNPQKHNILALHLLHAFFNCAKQVSLHIMKFKLCHMSIPYLYKSWNNACLDYTKSSVEDLYCCQDLAEEHHVRYGVKCVVEGI